MDDIRKSKLFIALLILYGVGIIEDLVKIVPCLIRGNYNINNHSIIFVNITTITILFIIQRIYKYGKYWAVSLFFALIVEIGKLFSFPAVQEYMLKEVNVRFIIGKTYFLVLLMMTFIALIFYLVFVKKEFWDKKEFGKKIN